MATLRDWLLADREWLTSLRILREGGDAWERSGRDEGELLRGTPLTVADQLEQRRDRFTDAEAAFVDAVPCARRARATSVERQLATQLRTIGASVGRWSQSAS